ncbi:MAG: branched-chain amino acid ABC transporter permease [Thermoproteota archaeon]
MSNMLNLLIQSVINGLLMGCVYALAAMGLALIYGVMNIINFAHGEFIMLSMYLVFVLNQLFNIDPAFSPLLTIPIFFIFGMIVYYGLINRVITGPPLSQIAVTVGLLILLRNTMLAVFKAEPKGVPFTIFAGTLQLNGYVITMSRLLSAIISIFSLIILHLFLTKTYLGTTLRAVADDMETASLMGVNVKKMYALAFGLGSSLIGLAGSLIMTFQQVNPLTGILYGLLAWCIVAMAGLGGVSGVLLSGLILGVSESIGLTFWDPRAREIILYLIFILILWFKPTGLFARR